MKLVDSLQVEEVLRRYLQARGYKLSRPRRHGETGCDIIAKSGSRRIFIEVIGFQSVPSIRSREFYECFFRTISRYDQLSSDDRLAMALPKRFADGMLARRRQYGTAWDKLGEAFAALEIWYVDVESGNVDERSWLDPVGMTSDTNPRAPRAWHPKPGTIGHLVKQMILANRSYTDISAAVMSHFPESRFNKKHFAWYKNRLRQSVKTS